MPCIKLGYLCELKFPKKQKQRHKNQKDKKQNKTNNKNKKIKTKTQKTKTKNKKDKNKNKTKTKRRRQKLFKSFKNVLASELLPLQQLDFFREGMLCYVNYSADTSMIVLWGHKCVWGWGGEGLNC